ncbi:transcriptional regulator [Opitutaceae bacterium TAV1]|nr:transcriptional regulator [Opitutaceae bacterium TAV1]
MQGNTLSTPTYRDIAALAGVSVFSVSCALRNRPGISAERRAHIKAVAEQAGYRPNPLVTALMTQHRRPTARRQMRAIIACLMSAQTEKLIEERSSQRERYEGVRAACEQAGFLFEKLRWDDFGESSRRLFAGLRTRRVPGVVFQGGDVPEWCLSGWDNYALASVGNRRINLPCHFASTDDYRNAWIVMETLAGLGYGRIGLAMARVPRVVRSDYRALAAFQAWTTQSGRKGRAAPPPYWEESWSREPFLQWYRKHRPDVIIAIERTPLDYLKKAGLHVPDDAGFVHLDLDAGWQDLTGIRQNHHEAGQAAAHLVIDQINRNAYGVPAHPRSIQITGDWFAGATVRSPLS